MLSSTINHSDYFIYLEKWKVLVCRSCKHGLPKKGVERHLRAEHQVIPLNIRQTLNIYAQSLSLLPPSEVQAPRRDISIPVFDCLELYQDGCYCTVCDAIYGTEGSMIIHCQAHNWVKSQGNLIYSRLIVGKIWTSQPVQTFFAGYYRKYFLVTPSTSIIRNPNLKVDLINNMLSIARVKDDEAQLNIDTIQNDAGKTENSPWLTRTDWKRMFKGRDMKSLVNQASKDTGEDNTMKSISRGIHRVIEKCIESIRDLDRRGWNEIRFWLRSTEKGKCHSKPFHKELTDLKKYADAWVGLILFCLRTFESEESGAEFLPKQVNALINLQANVNKEEENDMEIDKCILDVSTNLIQHSDFEKCRSVIKYFGGVKGYKLSESRWKRPGDYTPTLAALQFCIRVLSLEHCLPLDARNKYIYNTDSATPLQTFQEFHSKWLVEGEAQPFSYVHKLLNYGIYAAKEAKGADKIRIINGQCFYDGGSFLIQAWKQMNKDILRRAEAILSRQLLFRNTDTIDSFDPYIYIDQERNFNNGFSLASLIPDYRHRAREVIMTSLGRSSKWNSMVRVNENGIEFLAEGKDQYMQADDDFRELILVEMNWTGGLTGRGTEMESLLFENKQAAGRNIYIDDGQIKVITEYHKSQAITDDIKVRARNILI